MMKHEINFCWRTTCLVLLAFGGCILSSRYLYRLDATCYLPLLASICGSLIIGVWLAAGLVWLLTNK